MKKINILALMLVLITVFCSGCILPDGDPLTTESVREMVEKRYGQGKVEVKQLDKKTWRITPKDYPDIKYTIKQKIGHGGVIPVPAYTHTDDRMKQVGRIVVPKFFSAEERKKLCFSGGIIKISFNVKSDDEVAALCTKLEAMCAYMHDNYGAVVKDEYVMTYFQETPLRLKNDRYQKKPVKWDKLSKTKITSYLDTKYGNGTYTFKRADKYSWRSFDDISHEGEVEVYLNDYPDMPFYLSKKINASQSGKLTDTLYNDMVANVAFNFPKEDYEYSSNIKVSAQEKIDGLRYNGVMLDCCFKWGDETGAIENMQVIRKALRNYLNQYPMVNYSDYPKNQHEVEPPICMEISVQF
ncbi:hypothetical protein [Mogibacterium pumilum]|uniref:Uncharacterized protein n=1 Tax=Mogibacterium pumilum TaxID=86332 RepID=A0A223ASK9_9FIRM|nr:hypothetical protein [Mogibacterium pumilum]ASS37950.1 hypothetical protein AXF17_05580 [Mogibacterium pumilum]